MGYMEIALLPNASLRIKGKHATFGIDPQDKSQYNAIILFTKTLKEIQLQEETVIVAGVGEYEVGGIKMTGTKSEEDVAYSMNVDGVEVLLGKINSLEKLQHKLKEHNIIVVYCDTVVDASFLTSLVSSVIIFYGEKAPELSQTFGKESTKQMAKYSVTLDKLPAEVETILLANS